MIKMGEGGYRHGILALGVTIGASNPYHECECLLRPYEYAYLIEKWTASPEPI